MNIATFRQRISMPWVDIDSGQSAVCRLGAVTSEGWGSGPQIQISLRLQFRDPNHAASVGADESGQQVLQRNIL
jgi:hypothetical protein